VIRIAFLEEWPSLRAFHVLPYLCEQFEITYITTGKGLPDAKFKEVIGFPDPKFHLQRALAFSRCTDRLYRDGKIDFAFSYSCIGYLIRRTPYISFLGGSYLEDIKVSMVVLPWYRRWRVATGFLHYGIPELISTKRAKKVLTNSEALGAQVCRNANLSPESVSVIYNGVDESFRAVFRAKDFSRAHAALYIGRLHVRKGILNLVRAFAKRPSLDIGFYVVGDGPDRGEIKSLAKKDHRIIVLNDLDAAVIRQVMGQTKYFLFPSLHEGCPNALLEAMASGHVCIAYDIPAVREILSGTGIVVPPGDAHGILDQLERLLDCEDSAKRWIEAAHQRAQRFCWISCAKELETAFRKMYSTLAE